MVRSTVAGLLVATAVLGTTASAAIAYAPIKPNQHFSGLVNGSDKLPVVYTVCAGPVWAGRTGSVASGQTMSVVRAGKADGYTGPFQQVYGWFVQDPSGNGPQMLKFTEYGVAQATPSTVQVPSDGPGQAEFSSCPNLAPCVAGFVPEVVDVRFVNIAV
jgi:hypothetical protein